MIVVDTSFVYALLDRRDARHREAAVWYQRTTEDWQRRRSCSRRSTSGHAQASSPERRFGADVRAGAYMVEWSPAAARQAAEIVDRYSDHDVSLTDASLVALAERIGTRRIATFDERHFRSMRPLQPAVAAFTLVPPDAD